MTLRVRDEVARRRSLVGIGAALTVALAGLIPGLPGGDWLFALGSLALVPLLFVHAGGKAGSVMFVLALLLGAAAAAVLLPARARGFGWPWAWWLVGFGFVLGPWALLGWMAWREIAQPSDGTAGEESGGEGAAR